MLEAVERGPVEKGRLRPYSARELGELLGKSEDSIYRLARLGLIPCLRWNRLVLFPVEAVHKMLSEGNTGIKRREVTAAKA